jgi:predicted RNA polymerase sigma factor
MLDELAPGPVVTLNHAVAVAMVDGPDAGLAMLEPLRSDRQLRHHRLHAVRGHLLEISGRPAEARAAYAAAASLATSTPEQRYLNSKVMSLIPDPACAEGAS